MKPLKLTMQAFESYAEKTVIDFTKPDQNIFLITGDTGAGKTTIFDAVVFALYGEASSENNKKNGTELQSQYADIGTDPYVELEFSEKRGGNDLNYTVRRVPQHINYSKRPKNDNDLKKRTGEVTLIMPDGSTFQKKEADIKIEDITGLTKEQFMQIAMIAQGEFMEMLRVDSNKKKEIFRKLFNTDLYESIMNEFDKRDKVKAEELRITREKVTRETERVKIPEGYEISGRMKELGDSISRSGEFSITSVREFASLLKELCTFLKEDIETGKIKEKAASDESKKKRDKLTEANTLIRAFENYERASAELKKCEEEEPEIQEKRKLINRIESSYEVKETGDRLEEAKKEKVKIEDDLEDNRKRLPELEKIYTDEEDHEKKAAAVLNEEISDYTAVREHAEKTKKVLDEILNNEKKRAEDERKLQDAGIEKDRAEKALKKLKNDEKEWRKRSEELEGTEVRLNEWKNEIQKAEGTEKMLKKAVSEKRETEAQKELAETAENEYLKIKADYDKAKNEYDEKSSMFFDEQAGVMAQELRDGEPCPVCGALKHPHPAVFINGKKEITKAALDKLRKKKDKLENEVAECSKASGSAKESFKQKELHFGATLKELEEEIKTLTGSVPGDPGLDAAETHIRKWKENMDKKGNVLIKENEELAGIKVKIANAGSEREKLESAESRAEEQLNNIQSRLSVTEKQIEDLHSQKYYDTKEEAENALKTENEKKKKAEDDLNTSRINAKKAGDEKERISALIAHAEEELPHREDKIKTLLKEYEDRMKEKEISENEWRRLTEKYKKADIQELRDAVEEFGKRKERAGAAAKTAEKTAGGREKPDIEALKIEYDEADKAERAARERLESLNAYYGPDKEISEEIEKLLDETGKKAEESALIKSLHERLSGKRTGSRMDLETFVQRYYLERIMSSANRHFSDMTSGQYELKMTDIEAAGRGKNRGLDLMVYSAVTGKTREIRTLSGGESFMAALSLALGMADQIMMNSGAINLDMIFIDEGFGSLDDHSREQAVRVLKEMAEGSRLIGIISHVTELKQEIDDQLIVSKDENGSHVKWQIR